MPRPLQRLYALFLFSCALILPSADGISAAPQLPQHSQGQELLKDLQWQAIRGSEMNTVFRPGVDNQPWINPRSWPEIQGGWSGAACSGKELIVWGGGHSNGNHNGLLAVSPQGKWRRITEPSPIWTESQCPGNVCPAVTGPCPYRRCNTGPDGRPVSRHTYYLLGYHNGALYSVTGATAPTGGVGESPTVWRYVIAKGQWEALPETPSPVSHGSIVIVGNLLYHSGAWKGMSVLDLTTLTWSRYKGSGKYGGQVGMVYVPTLDRIYFIGNSRFDWVNRSAYGVDAPISVPRQAGDEILDARHLGLAYYAAADVILAWDGGRDLHVINPHSNTVSRVAVTGDNPGPALKNGTFGRLSDCGGRIMLVNGVDRPLYVLARADGRPLETATPTINLPPASNVASQPSVSALPQATPSKKPPRADKLQRHPKSARKPVPITVSGPRELTDPYYPAPPGGSLAAFDTWVDKICGPRGEWAVYEVGPGKQHTDPSQIRLGSGDRAVIRLYGKDDGDYPKLELGRVFRCVEVLGVSDAKGRRPTINGINATRTLRSTVAQGGLIIRNVHVRRVQNDCIGVPNDMQFFAVEDSLVEQCGHHALITGGNPNLYVRILRSHFRYAGSHLVYINRVARSDVIGNRCEAPGWGHCLRTMARVYAMDDNEVSNIHLDGTIPPPDVNPIKPNKRYIGMHPIDVYSCSDGTVRGNRVTYYRKQGVNIPVPINIRYRTSHRGCEVGEHDGSSWTVLDPKSPEFFDPDRWQRIRAAGQNGYLTITVRDNAIKVLGPDRAEHHAVGIQGGSYPIMHNDDRNALIRWVRDWHASSDKGRPLDKQWADMRAAMPTDDWRQIADLVLPGERLDFLRGSMTHVMPLTIPVETWFQRQVVRIGTQRLTVCDDSNSCRSSTKPPLYPEAIRFVYYGKPDPSAQFSGPTYRRAVIELVP